MLKVAILSLLAALAQCVSVPAILVSNDTTLWPSQLYKTESFTAPRVASSLLGPTAPGLIFLTLAGPGANSSAPMIMTEQGQLVWRPETSFASANFQVQTLNGSKVLTFWNGTISPIAGAGYGSVYVLDSAYNIIYTVCAADLDVVPLRTVNATTDCKLDFHESKISARGTLLATVRSVLSGVDLSPYGGPTNGSILDSLFYELDIASGNVIFRWSAYEHRASLPLTLSHYPINISLPDGAGTSPVDPWDFFHMNSIEDVGDSFLISTRYFWSAIMVGGDGAVKWVLNGGDGGNFTLPANAGFRYQHDIRVVPQSVSNDSMTITMFDDNDDEETNPPAPSSGLELSLDLTNYTVTVVRRLQDPEDLSASVHTGSYQGLSLPGHVFLDYGQPPIIKEFDNTGSVVYSAQFGTRLGADIYRAYKYDWDATPSTSPKIAASHTAGVTEAWVSWNGATNVTSWAFYAGTSKSALGQIMAVNQGGYFETHVTLNATYGFVQAEARAANGANLGRSAIVVG